MSKKQWCDWSDLHAGKVGEREHPLSKPIATGPTLQKGEVPRQPTDAEVRATILNGMSNPGLKQATDQELFGHMVVSEEQVVKAQRDWQNTFQDWYDAAKRPAEKQDLNKTKEWSGRGPVDQYDESQLTEEEQLIRQIPVRGSNLED